MKDEANLDARLAQRIAALRATRGYTLAELADRSGVSRSMISLIERAETSATAVVLDKLASALGVVLAELFQEMRPASAASPLRRRQEQVEWRDPASGYRRRVLSPGLAGLPLQAVEVHFPPGARVALESNGSQPPFHQQIWLLTGRMEIAQGEARQLLSAGDCLAMTLDRPTHFHNPGRATARYLVMVVRP